MKVDNDSSIEDFTLFFLRSRFAWRNVPRLGITNFGNIISMLLYRQPPFQVELFISPQDHSSFTEHRHPDVDTIELGLSGDSVFILNGKSGHSQEQMDAWLKGEVDAPLIKIKPTDWHSGYGNTPYAFLSMQKWLNGVEPSSVGLNWEGKPSSIEQEMMWQRYMVVGSEQQMLA